MMQEKTCATGVSKGLMKNLQENLLRICHQHAAAENPGPLWVEIWHATIFTHQGFVVCMLVVYERIFHFKDVELGSVIFVMI